MECGIIFQTVQPPRLVTNCLSQVVREINSKLSSHSSEIKFYKLRLTKNKLTKSSLNYLHYHTLF